LYRFRKVKGFKVKSSAAMNLNSEASTALFMKGKECWNKWVEENKNCNIDFSGVNFSKLVQEGAPVSFSGFKFPFGKVLFRDANFCDRDVDFSNVDFGGGNISFEGAVFGRQTKAFKKRLKVYFNGANFGCGRKNFTNVEFRDSDVSFFECKFQGGNINFTNTDFGDGDLTFSG